MITRNDTAAGTCTLHCEACGDGITHDVVRVDEGHLYHLRCFRNAMGASGSALYECPRCMTIGSYRAGPRGWSDCELCAGLGYLAVGGREEDAGGREIPRGGSRAAPG